MSIRLRLTLFYSVILALTLAVFGSALYLTQAQFTLNSLKRDLVLSGENVSRGIMRNYLDPNGPGRMPEPPPPPRPPVPFETLSGTQAFKDLREREIVRVLNPDATLVSSPFSDGEALPLSAAGLQTVQSQQPWWETVTVKGERMLVYDNPLIADGQVVFIVQVARTLTERDRSLATLGSTLLIASLVTTLAAFGIGWALSGAALSPIHRITQTAQMIGNESDFTRRVAYHGPNDEIGQLATTFNSMLKRLENAYLKVNQALKMQREFVADVSHELRTPLTTVHGNLALLRHDPPLPVDEQVDILTDLMEESDRLIRLVNNLLLLARADAGRNLNIEAVPVRPVIDEVCRQSNQLDQKRKIVKNVPDLTALCDRDALKQVLLILLDNAIKHSQGTIRVMAELQGEQALISVCDNGPGIAPEVLEHIFDRFYRASPDASTPGFGLGLPIAKALVEGQGGSISIESDVGCGSIVRICLPMGSTQ
jgi:two-component system, OmpR family, sensor kinase